MLSVQIQSDINTCLYLPGEIKHAETHCIIQIWRFVHQAGLDLQWAKKLAQVLSSKSLTPITVRPKWQTHQEVTWHRDTHAACTDTL